MTSAAMPTFHPARALAVLALPLALCACAAGPQLRGPTPGIADAREDDSSVYGLYLAGEAALDDGASAAAASFFGEASRRAPERAELKQHAFAAALLAGEAERAAALAPQRAPDAAGSGGGASGAGGSGAAASGLGGSGASAYALGQITLAVVELAHGEDHAAYQRLSASSMGEHWAAASLLRPWAAAADGDWSVAVSQLPGGSDRAVEAFGQLNHALLLERAGKLDRAEEAFASQAGRSGVFALAYGGYLERRGRRTEALALYRKGLAKDPTDPAFGAARARAAAGGPAPPAPSLRTGAAEALVGPAALLLAQKQGEAGLAYLRLALTLDPDLSEAWVLVGDALEGQHDVSGARAAYARVKPGSPEYTTAQGRLALDLQEDGRKAEALGTAQALAAARPDDPHTALVLADLYRDDERYPEAVSTLDKLIATVDPATAADWRLYYLRGAALEREGRWSQAQADLQHALSLKPDDPEVMNYLGFAWADRGEHLDQALPLLEKANALSPESGAFVDSLGWAHYRLGQYPQAVVELERAASLEPADPDINTHLGDAYWRIGRKLEAQYQWRRVLTLEPDAPTRTAIEERLAHGLPAGQVLAAGSAPP